MNYLGNIDLPADARRFPARSAASILLAGNPAGLYWLAGGVIISFAKAVLDAWVLLVEINR